MDFNILSKQKYWKQSCCFFFTNALLRFSNLESTNHILFDQKLHLFKTQLINNNTNNDFIFTAFKKKTATCFAASQPSQNTKHENNKHVDKT